MLGTSKPGQPGRGPSPLAPEIQAAEFGRAPAFGVALLDNPNELSAGWACLSGFKPIRFSSPNELETDAVWVTSVKYDEYVRRAKSAHNLRRLDYFRTSLPMIAADLGTRITREYAVTSSELLADIAQRSVSLAVRLYGWTNPVTDLREDLLQEDIRRSLAQAPKPQRHMVASLISAYQAFSTPTWLPVYETDMISVTLRYNRLDYAQRILATLVPDEGWNYIPNESVRGFGLDDFLNPERPCLVEASVEVGAVDPSLAALIAFGQSPGKRQGMRKWISQPELMWLHRHARVNVESAYFSPGGRELPASARLSPLLTEDPLLSLSYSAGLVAESHWSALCGPTYNRQSRLSEVSTWAVWLRAMDRAMCFSLAMDACRAGYQPFGYGNGSVIVNLKKAELPRLLEFAQEHGLSFPTFKSLYEEHGVV
jgi:hypothetical protein